MSKISKIMRNKHDTKFPQNFKKILYIFFLNFFFLSASVTGKLYSSRSDLNRQSTPPPILQKEIKLSTILVYYNLTT